MAPVRAVPARPKRQARAAKRAETGPALDTSPSRYIMKVDRTTGAEVPGPIDPEELLVHAHRDNHPVEIAAQFAASRFIQLTGNEALVKRGLRAVDRLGGLVGEAVEWATGSRTRGRQARKLLGVASRDIAFRFRETTHLSEKEVKARVGELQKEARAGLRDPRTKEIVKVLSPRQRGALLLKRLRIAGAAARKFRFVEGDIEKPLFGIAEAERKRLRASLTHVIHCAASVSFDDPYETSFRANVLGCRNALAFSRSAQEAEGSRFVCHVAIETSYIHGRRKRTIAQIGRA